MSTADDTTGTARAQLMGFLSVIYLCMQDKLLICSILSFDDLRKLRLYSQYIYCYACKTAGICEPLLVASSGFLSLFPRQYSSGTIKAELRWKTQTRHRTHNSAMSLSVPSTPIDSHAEPEPPAYDDAVTLLPLSVEDSQRYRHGIM